MRAFALWSIFILTFITWSNANPPPPRRSPPPPPRDRPEEDDSSSAYYSDEDDSDPDMDWVYDWWRQTDSLSEYDYDSSSSSHVSGPGPSQIRHTASPFDPPPAPRTNGNADLDGPPGSVCPRSVLQSVSRVERIPYPCFQKREVSCRMCGRNCRKKNGRCYQQTESTCFREEVRCREIWTIETYCCVGYEQVGNVCVDTQSSVCGGCEHMCIGGVCECFHGYRLLYDGSCEDIDECTMSNGGCNQGCRNMDGGHFCTCRDGYRLTDKNTCTEIDECATENGGCAHTCHNTEGAFFCECDNGFTRLNGFECEDVDECAISTQCSHHCVNLPGGFACACPFDMELSVDDRTTCIAQNGASGSSPPYTTPRGGLAAPVASSPMSIETIIIVGSVAGVAIILIAIVIIVCVVRRTSTAGGQTSTTQPSPARGGATNPEAAYESTRRVTKDGGVVSGPPQYDNHAYDKLVHEGKKPMIPPTQQYLQAVPSLPPSYVEATAPSLGSMKISSARPESAGNHSPPSANVYEAINYGQQNQNDMHTYLELISSAEYDNNATAPPLPAPRGSSPMVGSKTPPPPSLSKPKVSATSSPASKSKMEKAAPAPLSNQQLAAAMKGLKKVSK